MARVAAHRSEESVLAAGSLRNLDGLAYPARPEQPSGLEQRVRRFGEGGFQCSVLIRCDRQVPTMNELVHEFGEQELCAGYRGDASKLDARWFPRQHPTRKLLPADAMHDEVSHIPL